MNNEFDEKAQLDVEISNLYASDVELEKLKSLVAKGMGSNATELFIQSIANTAKGTRYEIKFRVIDPRHFDIDLVKGWLHEVLLVGWHLSATFVRP